MAKEIKIQVQLGKISINEFIEYLIEVDGEHIPPISKCVVISKYAQKLLDKAYIVNAQLENKLVGVCAFYCDATNKKSFISTFGVLKKFKKKGIGKKLINATISISKDKKMDKILLEVNEVNNIAIEFYEKQGFKTSKLYKKSDLEGVSRNWKLMIKVI